MLQSWHRLDAFWCNSLLSVRVFRPQTERLFHLNYARITHCGRDLCSLRRDSKTSTNLCPSRFHDSRSVLTTDLSNLSVCFFFIKSRMFTFACKGGTVPLCQHLYSCALGPSIKSMLLEHKACDTETVPLTTGTVTTRWGAWSVELLDGGVTGVQGRTGWERLPHTQKDAPLKT